MWLGAIVALPVVALAAPDQITIPPVEPHGSGAPPEAATFSHWEHDGYYCYNCHPAIFPQRPQGFTHAEMEQGEYCGACHDGERVWAPKGEGVECETCHIPSGEQEDIDTDELW
ncbi:MAG: c(7)-type cytochrome triheme domain-containing protein [Myxococcota bacterium]